MGALTDKKQIRNIRYRLAVLLCVGLLLSGCGHASGNTSEQKVEPEEEQLTVSEENTAADQVLEVGVLMDYSAPYAVAVFETFSVAAGKADTPVAVELHDCRDGYEAYQDCLELFQDRSVELLMVDMMEDFSEEEQQNLAEGIRDLGIPVLYFGTVPEEETLEITGGRYVGLSEKEEKELKKILKKDGFEESEYPEKAVKTGEELLQLVLEQM
ncbi:MAG: hypothetical protein IJ036_00935 [Lachnospiraceae bacterium]|nr:hypothetical protein [Lachnospiraceae bacterium]